jgi:DNA transposition AAA+ family ATPase
MTTDPRKGAPNESVSDALGSQERSLLVARTLPNSGPLTDAERKDAIANFVRYLTERGITTDFVARQLGKPKKTVIDDMVKRGIFRANCDDHIRKLNNWIEQHARQRAALRNKDKFIATRVAKDMLGVAATVREDQVMGLVMGPTGIGKSRCALALHEKYVGSVYVRVARGSHTARGLTEELAKALKVRYGKYSMMERVVSTLSQSGRLLIIDEAHQLRNDALELLRDVYDLTGVPILLIATMDLYDRIRRASDPDHGQLYSRFAIFYNLTEGAGEAGGKQLFTAAEIRELYNDPTIKLSLDAAQYLTDLANELGMGSLRRCENVLRVAARRARKAHNVAPNDRVTVTAADLQWAERKFRHVGFEWHSIEQRTAAVAATA